VVRDAKTPATYMLKSIIARHAHNVAHCHGSDCSNHSVLMHGNQ
jgi:hypothetical protein